MKNTKEKASTKKVAAGTAASHAASTAKSVVESDTVSAAKTTATSTAVNTAKSVATSDTASAKASSATSTGKKAAPKKKAASKAKPKTKATSPVVSHGVGRRKSSVARVWLRRGKGDINVNGKNFADYFDIDFNRDQASVVFDTMKVVNYDVEVNVSGGGVNSQAQAVKLGIARALVEHDAELKTAMRPYHFLSCDSRVKERKKYGQKAARRKFQFVKR